MANGDDARARLIESQQSIEVQVLGGMMLNSDACADALAILDPLAFALERHQHIFAALRYMWEHKIPFDLVTGTAELERQRTIKEVGGAAYLADVAASVGTSANVEYHAKILLTMQMRREVRVTGHAMVRSAEDMTEEISATIEAQSTRLMEISERGHTAGFEQVGQIVGATGIELEQGTTGLSSGWKAVDDLLGGFKPGELYIVAARPRIGKTVVLLNIARYLTTGDNHNTPLGLFSLEMTSKALLRRMVADIANVDSQELTMSNPKVADAVETIKGASLWIDDTAALSPVAMKAKARTLVRRHGARLIMVDYLQLMTVGYRAESREREIAEFMGALKAMAKDLAVPVMAACQVNREVEKRTDIRHQLGDLRESGSIEQDADVVLFVERPEEFGIDQLKDEDTGEKVKTKNRATFRIRKNRTGPSGRIRMQWNGPYQRFTEGWPAIEEGNGNDNGESF